MTTKTLAVLADAGPKISIAELTSGTPVFEWTIPPPGGDSSPRHERVTQLNLDNYQIALVPFQDGQDRAGGNPPRDGRIGRLLLLPLTWKEFVTRVFEMGHLGSFQDKNIVRFGQVQIDFFSMEVRRSDRPVSLTAMEFKALKFFVSNPNRVISRDQLLNEVWGYDNYPCTRTVDNHVLKLRQKLEADPAHPVHFRTVHGTGYKFIA